MLDGGGACCPTGAVDACGVCGGGAAAVDARGACCAGPVDARGVCCPPPASLDECGVCGGTGDSCAVTLRIDIAPAAGNATSPVADVERAEADRVRAAVASALDVPLASVAVRLSPSRSPGAGIKPGGGGRGTRAARPYVASVAVPPPPPSSTPRSTPFSAAAARRDVRVALTAAGGAGEVAYAGRTGVCGNGVCEVGERAYVASAPPLPPGGTCPADCPVPYRACPVGGADGMPCSSAGRCLATSGVCDCFAGRAGAACDACAPGWQRAPGGVCVPAAQLIAFVPGGSDGGIAPEPIPPVVAGEPEPPAVAGGNKTTTTVDAAPIAPRAAAPADRAPHADAGVFEGGVPPQPTGPTTMTHEEAANASPSVSWVAVPRSAPAAPATAVAAATGTPAKPAATAFTAKAPAPADKAPAPATALASALAALEAASTAPQPLRPLDAVGTPPTALTAAGPDALMPVPHITALPSPQPLSADLMRAAAAAAAGGGTDARPGVGGHPAASPSGPPTAASGGFVADASPPPAHKDDSGWPSDEAAELVSLEGEREVAELEAQAAELEAAQAEAAELEADESEAERLEAKIEGGDGGAALESAVDDSDAATGDLPPAALAELQAALEQAVAETEAAQTAATAAAEAAAAARRAAPTVHGGANVRAAAHTNATAHANVTAAAVPVATPKPTPAPTVAAAPAPAPAAASAPAPAPAAASAPASNLLDGLRSVFGGLASALRLPSDQAAQGGARVAPAQTAPDAAPVDGVAPTETAPDVAPIEATASPKSVAPAATANTPFDGGSSPQSFAAEASLTAAGSAYRQREAQEHAAAAAERAVFAPVDPAPTLAQLAAEDAPAPGPAIAWKRRGRPAGSGRPTSDAPAIEEGEGERAENDARAAAAAALARAADAYHNPAPAARIASIAAGGAMVGVLLTAGIVKLCLVCRGRRRRARHGGGGGGGSPPHASSGSGALTLNPAYSPGPPPARTSPLRLRESCTPKAKDCGGGGADVWADAVSPDAPATHPVNRAAAAAVWREEDESPMRGAPSMGVNESVAVAAADAAAAGGWWPPTAVAAAAADAARDPVPPSDDEPPTARWPRLLDPEERSPPRLAAGTAEPSAAASVVRAASVSLSSFAVHGGVRVGSSGSSDDGKAASAVHSMRLTARASALDYPSPSSAAGVPAASASTPPSSSSGLAPASSTSTIHPGATGGRASNGSDELCEVGAPRSGPPPRAVSGAAAAPHRQPSRLDADLDGFGALSAEDVAKLERRIRERFARPLG